MNLPNFATLILLVLALNFFLFALLFPASMVIKNPVDVIDEASKIMPIDKPPFFDEIIGGMPWLLGIGLFVAFTVPGLCLAGGGYAIWRLGGRPKMLEEQRQAALEPERESMLQAFLTQLLGRLAEVAGPGRGLIFEGLAKLQPRLDAGRQERLRVFLQKSGLDRGDLPWLSPEVPKRRRTLDDASRLAHTLALGLLILAGAGFLFGLVIGSFSGMIADFYRELLGLELDARDGLFAMSFLWVLSASPAALGFGFLRMARLDRGLAERWRKGREAAEGALLAGYREQMAALRNGSGASPLEVPEARRVVAALASSMLPELGSAGRREGLGLLHELGLTRHEPPILEPGAVSFAGIDLTGVDLQGARLPGIDLAGALLARANLAETDLSGARLVAADLRQADLGGAKLWRADLRSARLQHARLVGADLREAGLWDANLFQVDFSGADLEGAQMHEAQRQALTGALPPAQGAAA